MALSARLEMRQGQQLVMTPQLQQAIKLLQLSNIELSAFVEAELERNPLLERDEAEAALAETSAQDDRGNGTASSSDAEEESWLNLKTTSAASSPLSRAIVICATSFNWPLRSFFISPSTTGTSSESRC